MRKWLLLSYRVPREPTASRVFVWRKLKQLAAVAIQDAVWVLPKNSRTLEQFQWLASEITQIGGEAMLWEGDQVYATDSASLESKFTGPIMEEYKAICIELKKKNCDLDALSKRFVEANQRDYFSLELGKQTRAKLLARGGG